MCLFPADRQPPKGVAHVQIRMEKLILRRARQWGACWLALEPHPFPIQINWRPLAGVIQFSILSPNTLFLYSATDSQTQKTD